MSDKKKQRRRDRLLARNPHCHWCGCKVRKFVHRKGERVPDDAATIDHRHGKLDPRRRIDWSPDNWSVLSCWRCNQKRNMEDHRQAGIDELRRRAGRWQSAGPSFNGRTPDFDSGNAGSSPAGPANHNAGDVP